MNGFTGTGVARIGAPGMERPIVAVDGNVCDASSLTADITGEFLANDGIDQLVAAASAGTLPSLTLNGERFGPPIVQPSKVVCIGLNFYDHARETGAASPEEPIIFLKDPGCVIGPNDDILIPRNSVKTDWEVELAVVIGRTARYLDDPSHSPSHIAGFTIANDVSEREFQYERGGQWDKGKSCETFNPLGPWLVPASSLSDPQNLAMTLALNGDIRQSSSTSEMIFGINHIIWYLSQFMVLRPGDVINTGTPAGVAKGSADLRYLRTGDVLDLHIDQLGRQRQSIH